MPKSCEKFRDNLAKEITKAPNPTRSSKHILQKSKKWQSIKQSHNQHRQQMYKISNETNCKQFQRLGTKTIKMLLLLFFWVRSDPNGKNPRTKI